MFAHCKGSARLCKVFFYRMARSKYFSSFVCTQGFILFEILLQLLIGRVVSGKTGCIGDLELEMQNVFHFENPAIKTIQSEDGDIIDCVDILRQPAFHHPMLKNHSIQMRPSFYHREPESNFSSKSQPFEQIWQRSGSCPVGTVPIRRDTEEGLYKVFPLPTYEGEVVSSPRVETVTASSSHLAPYYGAKADLNLWQPYVRQCEHTTNRVMVTKTDYSDFVSSGWGVFDFGRSRVYASWKSTNGGCYNVECAGFVQTNNRITLGGIISPTSTYGGDQYEMEVEIVKDRQQSSWWLSILGTYVGYWPMTIFKDFQTSNKVGWGGLVYNTQPYGSHSNTQMGSGHLPFQGYTKAAYMVNLKVQLKSRVYVIPNDLVYFASHPRCYGISWPAAPNAPAASFLYGGAGYSGCD